MSDITTTYRGVEVAYIEHQDVWTCDLFTKPAQDLRTAKERIDKKLDTEKKTPFNRFKAFVKAFQYGDGSWPLVDVTSITDDGTEAWCTLGSERRKIGGSYGGKPAQIFPDTSENSALVESIHANEKAIAELKAKIEAAESQMTIYKPEVTQ